MTKCNGAQWIPPLRRESKEPGVELGVERERENHGQVAENVAASVNICVCATPFCFPVNLFQSQGLS